MRLSRLLACLSATGLLLAIVPVTDPIAAAARSVPPASGQSIHRVTLITGDKVVVRSQPGKPDEVRFQPGRGSGSTAATIVRGNGRVRVVPSSAHADLVAGRLDPALFDVSTLIANGYDDARSAVLPTIVEYAGTAAIARRSAAQDKLAGIKRARLLNSIGARGAAVGKATATQFWQSVTSRARVDTGIRRIHLDRRVRASLDRSVAQIGVPAAWQRGLTGTGVQVAVLDTGIDSGHPDLTGKVVRAANFSESPETTDRVGHGTHVAGAVAGTGTASGGSYRGVAPDATLLNGKVLGDDGFGSWSGVIAGMEWAVAQGADLVNMSLGGDPTDGTDPVSEAVNTLTRGSDTLFVIAAGNCISTAPQQVSSPASADLALAVANLERDGSLAESSCRGPRAGDRSLKPEIAAPGSGIVAPRASGTDIGEPVGEHYTTLTGTSMATPHVAGVAALLLQQQPALNAERLKTRLMTTSYVPWAGPGTYAMRFSRNGQLVGTAEAPIEGFEIEPGAADFRIELDAQRDLPWWRHSTRVRSVWDFHSEDGEYVLPPLLAASITVPQADVLNRVKTGRSIAIGLTLRHQSGSQASDITSAALELSYDGSTWTRLPLRRTGPGQYLTEVTHPSRQAGKAPSLRVTATDAAGGKLTQEVSRVYTLIAR